MTYTVTRHADAPGYEPPGHFGVSAARLQGHAASSTLNFWVSMSVYPPGSGVENTEVVAEAVYVVVEGALAIYLDAERHELGRYDSVHLTAGQARRISNESTAPCHLLVAMCYA